MAPEVGSLRGRRVLITGHTGFKGAWLAAYLHELGAEVCGFALPPAERGAFHDLRVHDFVDANFGDVRDADAVDRAIGLVAPDLVFHLAAQPLVRAAWADRRTTYATNVMGTINVLEAALSSKQTKGIVVVTTDKVYRNNGTRGRFVEGDPFGAHDPYGASKAATEVVLVPYRHPALMSLHAAPIVSVRAGNVIGGGDWAADRLVPDVMRALSSGAPLVVRRPDATRPWQHVLDCVRGYLLVGSAMIEGRDLSPAYNFAHANGSATVRQIVEGVLRHWGASADRIVFAVEDDAREESALEIDPSLAYDELGWRPAWSREESVARTVASYQDPSCAVAQLAEHNALFN